MNIITNPKNKNKFLKIMAWIELCGNIGHTCRLKVNIDGDGKGRLKFKLDNEKEQKQFDNIRKNLLKEYETHGDLKEISLE